MNLQEAVPTGKNPITGAPERLPNFRARENENEIFELSKNLIQSMLDPWIGTMELRLGSDDSLTVADRQTIIDSLKKRISNTVNGRSFYMHDIVKQMRNVNKSLEAIKNDLDPKIALYINYLDGELEKQKSKCIYRPNNVKTNPLFYPSASQIAENQIKRRMQETRIPAQTRNSNGVFGKFKGLFIKN